MSVRCALVAGQPRVPKSKKKDATQRQRRKLQKQQKQKIRRELAAAAAAAEPQSAQSNKTSDEPHKEAPPELLSEIVESGNEVRRLKATKADFSEALARLLDAKAKFKQITGRKYVPPGYKPQRKVPFGHE